MMNRLAPFADAEAVDQRGRLLIAGYAVKRLSAGPELASFVSNADAVKHFGKDLQLQLDVAHELASISRSERGAPGDAFESVVQQLLRRDVNWRSYYDERVRSQLRQVGVAPQEESIDLVKHERAALEKAIRGDVEAAARDMSAAIALTQSPEKRADLLEAKSRYLFAHDPGESMRIQAAAYSASRTVAKPPHGVSVKPATNHDASSRLLALLHRHTSGNGLIAEFDSLRLRVSFDASAPQFEIALQHLGTFLGADSRRPESEDGEGPDNLWLWNDLAFVIEAKNEAKYAAIPKKDAEQLLHSIQWYRNNRVGPPASVPLFFGPSTKFDSGVHGPDGTRVVGPNDLKNLLGALSLFIAKFAARGAADWPNSEVHRLLAEHGLNGEELVKRFTSAAG